MVLAIREKYDEKNPNYYGYDDIVLFSRKITEIVQLDL